jgi:hypothetical protein
MGGMRINAKFNQYNEFQNAEPNKRQHEEKSLS